MSKASLPSTVALLAVILGVAFRVYVVSLPAETLTARYLADDYFYYLNVASNIAQGRGSSFDGGLTTTNGYQPLFLWFLTGAFVLGADKADAIHIGLAIQAAAAAIASLLAYAWLARRGDAWAGAGACGLLSVNLFFVLPTLTGFEMALALAAMLLAVTAWQMTAPPLLVGLLCGLSVLARVDTLVVPAVFGVSLVLQRRPRDLAWLGAGLVIVAGPYAIWNTVAFGHPLPDSGVIKAHVRGVGAVLQAAATAVAAAPRVLIPGRAIDSLLQAAPFVASLVGAIVLALCGRAAWQKENREIGAIALALSLSYLLLIDPQETGALVRYLFPVWAIAAMLLLRGCPALVVLLLLSAHAADLAVYQRWDRSTPPAPSFVGVAHALAPGAIAGALPAREVIGSFDAGALGYFSPNPVVNLDGLANHDIVELRRACRQPYDRCLRDYLRAKNIRVVAGGTGFGWTRLFPGWTQWPRLYESPPLIDGSRLVIVRLPESD